MYTSGVPVCVTSAGKNSIPACPHEPKNITNAQNIFVSELRPDFNSVDRQSVNAFPGYLNDI